MKERIIKGDVKPVSNLMVFKSMSKLDYAKSLLKIKRDLSTLDFTDHELRLIDILVSKLCRYTEPSESKKIQHYVKNFEDFSRLVLYERASREIQQKDMARILQMDKANYCRFENGKLNISLQKFIDICKKLDLDIYIDSLPF